MALPCLVVLAAPTALQDVGFLDLRLPAFASSTVFDAAAVAPKPAAASRQVARSIPICSGGRRAERRLTSVVDGDTGWEDGVKWRLTSPSGGVDAPEISKPECATEKAAGDRAMRRLQTLMSGGYTMSGEGMDRYDRRLVTITLADGRDVGEVLIAEGLAQPWPDEGNVWCGR